jgi:hypothetical protein
MNMINVIKVFSGHRPCQFVKDHQRFRDHLCPHHQGNETLVVFKEVTRLMAREDFVNVSRRESITSHMVSAAYRSVPVFLSRILELFLMCYAVSLLLRPSGWNRMRRDRLPVSGDASVLDAVTWLLLTLRWGI